MRASWGATTPIVVMPVSATSRSAGSGRQRSITWRVTPRRTYQGSFNAIPTWANWVDASIGPPPSQISSHVGPRSMAAIARSCRSRNSAAFGRPVVPDVKQTIDARSSSSTASSPGGAAVRESPTSSFPREPGTMTSTGVRSGSPSTASAVAITRAGRTRSMSAPRSAGGGDGRDARPSTAPARADAAATTTQSPPDGRIGATTSSVPMPRAGQRGGECRGAPVEVGVGQRAVRGDDRRSVGETLRGTGHRGAEDTHRGAASARSSGRSHRSDGTAGARAPHSRRRHHGTMGDIGPLTVERVALDATSDLRQPGAASGPTAAIRSSGPRFEVDGAATFAVLDPSGSPLATVTVMPEPCPWRLDEEAPWRLRGMATDGGVAGTRPRTRRARRRRRPRGRRASLGAVVQRPVAAVRFYERAGFSVEGDEFDVPGIGPHRPMARPIDPGPTAGPHGGRRPDGCLVSDGSSDMSHGGHMTAGSNAPLAGLRVIEASMLGPGAVGTHLADLGRRGHQGRAADRRLHPPDDLADHRGQLAAPLAHRPRQARRSRSTCAPTRARRCSRIWSAAPTWSSRRCGPGPSPDVASGTRTCRR